MVEQRQTRLAKNAEAIERWQRRLFRAATALQKLAAERKRLLKGSSKDRRTGGPPCCHPQSFWAINQSGEAVCAECGKTLQQALTGIGGGAVEGLDDDVGVL